MRILELLRIVVLSCVVLHVAYAQPGPPTNFSVEFMEDTRPGFLLHAVFFFSWTPPSDDALLSGYELIVELVPPSNPRSPNHNCSSMQALLNTGVQSSSTNFTLRSVDGSPSSLPLYTCDYTAMLVSQPGGASSEVLNIPVQYDSPMQRAIPEQELQLECTAHYDPENVMYTVNATWNLTNQHPLVLEALLAHEFRVDAFEFQRIPTSHAIDVIFFIHPEGNVTEVVAISVPPHPVNEVRVVVQVAPLDLNLNRNIQPFYWRSPLFPGRALCPIIPIPPQKPTQIPTEAITIQTDIFKDRVTIVVKWGPPQHTNGDLTSYEVCLSENGLEGEEDCDMLSLFNVPPDILTFERSQFIQAIQLAVQVRAVNEFHIAGSWSEAVTVDTPIPNFTIVTTNPPPGSSEIPSWVYIVIALVVLPVLILILVVVTVLVTRYYHKNKSLHP